MDQDGTWHGGGPWSRPHCARWGPSCPPQKGGRAPTIFYAFLLWPNCWMHQDATWYGGMRSPGVFVFDGDPAAPNKKAHLPPPNFWPCLFWPNIWMDEDTTWYGSRPRDRPHCIRHCPCCPRKGHSSPLFSPMSIVPRSPISYGLAHYQTSQPSHHQSPFNLLLMFLYCMLFCIFYCIAYCAIWSYDHKVE